jgi:hypothetical protein
MKKLFYAGLDHANYPADKLVAAVTASASVSLHFDMASSEPGSVNIEAKTVVACTASNEKKVLADIMEELNYGQDVLIDLAALPNVTAVTSSVYDVDPSS